MQRRVAPACPLKEGVRVVAASLGPHRLDAGADPRAALDADAALCADLLVSVGAQQRLGEQVHSVARLGSDDRTEPAVRARRLRRRGDVDEPAPRANVEVAVEAHEVAQGVVQGRHEDVQASGGGLSDAAGSDAAGVEQGAQFGAGHARLVEVEVQRGERVAHRRAQRPARLERVDRLVRRSASSNRGPGRRVGERAVSAREGLEQGIAQVCEHSRLGEVEAWLGSRHCDNVPLASVVDRPGSSGAAGLLTPRDGPYGPKALHRNLVEGLFAFGGGVLSPRGESGDTPPPPRKCTLTCENASGVGGFQPPCLSRLPYPVRDAPEAPGTRPEGRACIPSRRHVRSCRAHKKGGRGEVCNQVQIFLPRDARETYRRVGLFFMPGLRPLPLSRPWTTCAETPSLSLGGAGVSLSGTKGGMEPPYP